MTDSTLLVCEGCSLKFSDSNITGVLTVMPSVVGITDVNTGITVPSLGIPSSIVSKASCQGNAIYTQIYFTVAGATNGTTTAGTGTGFITGTTEKVFVGGVSPVRKQDKVTILVTGVTGSSSSSFDAEVTVDSPGQQKAWAE